MTEDLFKTGIDKENDIFLFNGIDPVIECIGKPFGFLVSLGKKNVLSFFIAFPEEDIMLEKIIRFT